LIIVKGVSLMIHKLGSYGL